MKGDSIWEAVVAETLAALHALSDPLSAFPSDSAAAYYEFTSQVVTLNAASSSDVKWVTENPGYRTLSGLYGLVVHELTHWLDHCSTLWGREHLIALYNMLNARALNDATHFHHVITGYRALANAKFPKYYSTTERPDQVVDLAKRWKYRYTAGAMFGGDGRIREDRPIVFTRFATHLDEDICRVPFSVASLCECSAVAAEYELDASLSAAYPEEDHEALRKEAAATQRLYDSRTALYSVAAHAIANQVHLTDARDAYMMAAQLAHLSMNLPVEAFPRLQVPSEFAQSFGDRCAHFLTRRDRGFAYLVLVHNVTERADSTEDQGWLRGAVQGAGLDLDVLENECSAELKAPSVDILDGPYSDRLVALLDLGARNYARRGGLVASPIRLDQLGVDGFEAPPLRLKDGRWWKVTAEPTESLLRNPVPWIDELSRLMPAVTEFVDACRALE